MSKNLIMAVLVTLRPRGWQAVRRVVKRAGGCYIGVKPGVRAGSARHSGSSSLNGLAGAGTFPAESKEADGATTAAHEAAGAQEMDAEALLTCVIASLEDDKAEELVTIALKGRSSVADHMVIASGRSSRQVAAIAEHLVERLKQDAGVIARVEGKEVGDWVLIDAGDVIVHLFRPEVREFYQLEKMWQAPGQRPPA